MADEKAEGMNTCDTCRHWDDESYLDPERNPHLLNMCVLRACNNIKLNAVTDDKNDFSDSVHHSGDGYGANATGPKFGCIHWEAK